MHPGTRAFAACMYTPPDPTMPQALKDLVRRQWERPGLWRNFASAIDSEATSSAEVVREQRSYGDLSLIVLTTTKDITLLPIPKRQKAALTSAWVGWHRDIAKLSRRGVDVIVEGSTLSIPIERPAAVSAAIANVAARVPH